MAKTRPDKRRDKAARRGAKASSSTGSQQAAFTPQVAQSLLDNATQQLHMGQIEAALTTAQKLQTYLSQPTATDLFRLPVHNLLGQIHLELGDADAARSSYLDAAKLDPDGALPDEAGGGPDKFLWLSQLSEEGGTESLAWFEKGIAALQRDVESLSERLDSRKANDELEVALLEEKRSKLASALCGAAELYMTDLSFDDAAETHADRFVTQAFAIAPDSPEVLQTLASVRLSQPGKEAEAHSFLQRSMDVWKDLDAENPIYPDFPTRISLVRLLLTAEMEERALQVLDRLVQEDDESVEAWYLGGWALHILAEKVQADADEARKLLQASRTWLNEALRLYQAKEYEDDRLRDHAVELVSEIDKTIGPAQEGENDEEAWEDAVDDDDDDDDEAMQGA